MKGERGEVALVVPDLPVRVDVLFAVGREAPLFWLVLKYPDSVAGGFEFTPAFRRCRRRGPLPSARAS